jgi:hypothetical protein
MFKKILLLSFIFLSLANQSNAASLDLQSDVEKVRINSYFKVDIFLNSEDVSVNTVEAKISFPKELVQLKEIRNGNSIVNFWVDTPKESDNSITFSGIIPGGYNDKKGLISSLLFESKDYGTGTIKFDSLQGFKNDGLGTPINLTPSDLTFYISKASEEYVPIEMEDNTKPESFTPEINQTQELFDGKYFLIFATQDKGLGIDHYEVCEGNIDDCVTTESPYLLKNQELNKKIFVKAIDKKGNERLATLTPQNDFGGYEKYLIFAIIILVVLLIIYLIKKLWIKLKH